MDIAQAFSTTMLYMQKKISYWIKYIPSPLVNCLAGGYVEGCQGGRKTLHVFGTEKWFQRQALQYSESECLQKACFAMHC